MTNKNEINEMFKTLAQYKMMEAEAKALKEEVEMQIKAIMEAEGIEELIGDEHKATWRMVNSTTFDKKGIIGKLADLTQTDAEAVKKLYTLPNPSMRFNFA